MKPRARRVTIAAAVLGAGVVAVLAVAHWSTVRDHAEAWWFVCTRETKTINPDPGSKVIANETWTAFIQRHSPEALYKKQPETFLEEIANYSDRPIIFDPSYWLNPWTIKSREGATVTSFLRANGLRLIEQRFPDPAYVLIGWEHSA
jgi:hypothetical protein